MRPRSMTSLGLGVASHPWAAYAADQNQAMEAAILGVRVLAFTVGQKQVDRCLQWAGSDPARLAAGRANLLADAKLTEAGEWDRFPWARW